ncbi:hypothetical protein [Planktothricoides raciborskii]|uniref:Uncharacterized protein n=1 Tax=Planktothricoides raciborskii GIHE-MW2 TaxID=2792601 RepID=A0AAU8JJ50_9CYAN
MQRRPDLIRVSQFGIITNDLPARMQRRPDLIRVSQFGMINPEYGRSICGVDWPVFPTDIGANATPLQEYWPVFPTDIGANATPP